MASTVDFHPGAAIDRIRRGIMVGVHDGAEIVRTESIRSMAMETKSGRHYRGNPRRSSAPGEPPARQTGFLIATLDIVDEPDRLAARVNAGADYAAALEFGTQKMAPRPFLRAALINKQKEVEDTINASIAFALVGDEFSSVISQNVGR
jgi:HK97 gp10 family phage protein